MNTVKVRDLEIGAGVPKICVPIVGVTREEILEQAEAFSGLCADVVEWRADWYEDVFEEEKVEEVLAELRQRLGEIPLLFTFRTAGEGGEKAVDARKYGELVRLAAKSGCVDLADVEAFLCEDTVPGLIAAVQGQGVKVVASNHDFSGTPEKEEILRRLCFMQELGADILKIAVMPKSPADVLTLLAATEEMTRRYADRPVVTMSMGADGVVSRICGEIFGSALTFGAAGRTSAPGQLPVEELSRILKLLHGSR